MYNCKLSLRGEAVASMVLVNFKYSFIFNGVFEMQNSTRNGKKFAEMRVLGT
jgi:hypothetical protein